MRPRHPRSRGYIVADVIMALAIVLILVAVLTSSVNRQRRASQRLADSRAALRLAEATLTALQTGAAPPPAPQGTSITVQPAAAPAGLPPPPGNAWVDVRITFDNGRSTSLSGLARRRRQGGDAMIVSPRRAFTILELLVALGLLGIFALTASRLFQSTIRVGHASAQAQNAVNSFDSAINVLRDDVWIAPGPDTPDPATLRLGDITWTLRETTLSRDPGDGAPRRSWTVPRDITFAIDGPAVILRLPSTSDAPGGELQLISQPLLLSRLSP